MKHGLLLFAHGARDPRWAAPFERIGARIREGRPDLEVELAFLELMAPTLAEAGSRLAARGCEAVDIVPLFLGAGGHVRNDLPVLLDTLAAEHPALRWRLHEPIGEVDAVIEAMARAALRMVTEEARP